MVIAFSTWPFNTFLSAAAGRSKVLTHAQGAYSDLASQAKIVLSRNPDILQILVQWPADIVTKIAKLLPPASLASLVSVCHQLRTLLDVDRMWQHQLQQCCLAWYATGVCPTDGHHDRHSWKQLAIAAANGQMMTFYIPVMTNLPAVRSKTQDIWNSGAEKLHLEMYLCVVQDRCSSGRLMMSTPSLHEYNISVLLELVYVLWVEQKQLQRGARFLAKAVSLLADTIRDPARLWEADATISDLQQEMWYQSSPMAELAAFAASCLIDLLLLASLSFSPMSVSAPAAFIQACKDQATCGPSCDSDTHVWYGASYARLDLEEAVREMTKPTATSHMFSRRCYTSCYESGSWEHLNQDAVYVLHFLAEFQAIQEDDWMNPPGLDLLAAALAHPAGHNSEAYRVFKEHVQYAGATFLTRLQRRASDLLTLADHGSMYYNVAQYARAAHYYRLQAVDCYSKSPLNPEFDVDSNLVNVAQAMYHAWFQTGELMMLQQALSWAMFLVERINNLQNMSADVCNYAPSNMSHVCEMLNHPDACQLSNLWPESFDVDLLRIGATLLGIHRLDQGGAVYLWLRSRIQAAFELLLKSNAVAASQKPPLPPSLLAVVQTGKDGAVGQESLNCAFAAPPALPAGLGTQHLQYFAGLSSTLFKLRKFKAGIALLRASAHILGMEAACEHEPSCSLLANFAAALITQADHLYRHQVPKQAFFLFHEAMVLAKHHQLGDSLWESSHTGMAWSILYLVQMLGCKTLVLVASMQKDGQKISIGLEAAESYGKLALETAADRAKALDVLAHVAEAKCLFQLAKQRYEEVHNLSLVQARSDQKYGIHAVSALVSIAEMLLKMGCVEQAQQTAISAAKLLKQYPSSPNVPLHVHAEQQLLILRTQVYICVEGSDLEGAKRYLQSVLDLCETTGIDQPGFVQRYLHGLVAASSGRSVEAQKHFRAALVAAQRQPDKQQEAQAVTAIGTLMCFYHPGIQKQEDGWKFLIRGLTLAGLVGDKLCEAHAAKSMLSFLSTHRHHPRWQPEYQAQQQTLQDTLDCVLDHVGKASVNSYRRLHCPPQVLQVRATLRQ